MHRGRVAGVVLAVGLVLVPGRTAAAALAPPSPVPTTVRLQLASFRTEAAALDFARTARIELNTCGTRVPLPPPSDGVTPVCPAYSSHLRLSVEPAGARGRSVHRVVSESLVVDSDEDRSLVNALFAVRERGIEPLIVK